MGTDDEVSALFPNQADFERAKAEGDTMVAAFGQLLRAEKQTGEAQSETVCAALVALILSSPAARESMTRAGLGATDGERKGVVLAAMISLFAPEPSQPAPPNDNAKTLH
jgi:hypothetical protein